jgi:L-fucose mutarotase
MLKTGLIHPQILEALAAAGHGSLVLISDGNFPSLTAPHPGARRVYLNLRLGVVTATDVLATLRLAIPMEKAVLMQPDDGSVPAVHRELVALLDASTPVKHVGREAFYSATRSEDLALVIATGDGRWYANILLTIGPLPQRGRVSSLEDEPRFAIVAADAAAPEAEA